MTLIRRKGALVLALLGTGLAALQAKADSLIGADLGWQYYGGGGPYGMGGSFIDNGTNNGEFFEGALPVFYIDADASTISFDYSPSTPSFWSTGSPLSLPPTIYNGIAITLDSTGSFENVTVDPATNMEGFGASNISFTSNQIEIDWSGLTYTTTTDVILDITFDSAPVSEPATFLLLGTALCILGTRRAIHRHAS